MALGISSKRMGCRCMCPHSHPRCKTVLILPYSRCASSKHLQTRRFLDTLKSYLHDVQRILIQLHRDANERPAPFVDHSGILRDSKTGRAINGSATTPEYNSEEEIEFRTCCFSLYDGRTEHGSAGYSFFDTGDVKLLGQRKPTPYSNVGAWISILQYCFSRDGIFSRQGFADRRVLIMDYLILSRCVVRIYANF